MSQYPATSSRSTPTLGHVRQAVMAHPWIVSVCVLAGVAIGVLAGLGSVPVYTATATLLVERQAQDLISFEALFGDASGTNSFSQTQIEMLTGTTMATRVVGREDIGRAPEFQLTTSGSGSFTRAREWFRSGNAWVMTKLGIGADEPLGALNTDSAIDPAVADLAETFQSALWVEPVQNTSLVRIHWTHPDPEFAARVANATAEAFLELNNDTRRELATEMGEYLQSQIVALRQDIAAAEAEQDGLIEGGREPGDLVSEISDLRSRHDDALAARIEAEIEHQGLLLTTPAEVSEVRAHPAVSALRTQLDDRRRELEDLMSVFTESYPRVGEVRVEIRTLERRLADEEQAVYQSLVADALARYELAIDQEDRLLAMIDERRGALSLRDESLAQWEQLQMRIDNSRELLDARIEQFAQTDLSGSLQGLGNLYLRVVEAAAVPRYPDAPARSFALIGLIAGLVLGVAAAFLREMVDDTLKSTDAAERDLGLPGLVVVPNAAGGGRFLTAGQPGYGPYDYTNPEASGYGYDAAEAETTWYLKLPEGADPALATVEYPHSVMAESYRALRTRLLFAGENGLPRTIAVTSSEQGEGKTTTAVNLACALAVVGKKTLLVDADLRRPSIDRFLDPPPNKGLVSLLRNGADLKRTVRRTGTPNLWVLPVGERTESPLELLSTPRCAEILEQAARVFDVVIVDTPPLLRAVDALTMVGKMDATLMVVQRAKTPLAVVDQVCQMVEEANGEVLGVLLNDSGRNQWKPMGRRQQFPGPRKL